MHTISLKLKPPMNPAAQVAWIMGGLIVIFWYYFD